MTITVTGDFGSSSPFAGPGHQFTAKSVFADNAAHTYSLNIRALVLPTLFRVLEIEKQPYLQGSNWDGLWGIQRDATEIVSVGVGGGIFGADVQLVAETIDTTAQVIVDGPETITGWFYDPTCQLYVTNLFIAGSGTGGGFNQGDRDQLTAVHNATVRSAYTSTATHVGLVDNGSITTLNLTRALRVTVTTFPPNVDRDLGTPEYFFNLGFVTLNASQGWVRSARLVFEFQLYEAPQSLDSFGWTLTPGTTINVEELAPT